MASVGMRNGKFRRFAFEDDESVWNKLDVVVMETIDSEPHVEISLVDEDEKNIPVLVGSQSEVVEMLEKILAFIKS